MREEGGLGRLVEGLSLAFAILGGICLVFIIVLTTASIAGRLLLTYDICCGPIPGDFELVEIAAGVAVFMFLPYCQLKRGHVTVDIFSGVMGPRGVQITELAGNVLMTGAAAIIVWRMALGLQDKMRSGEESFILGLPVWWGYALSIVGAAAFVLVAAYTIYRSVLEVASAATPQPHHPEY